MGSADGRRRRLSVVLFAGCAVAALTIRLAIAANTYGTNDMRTWAGFARLFHERGAAALYALAPADVPEIPYYHYNHPPVSLVLLSVVNVLSGWGLAFPLAFRLLPSLADLVTATLIFRRLGAPSEWTGLAGAALFLFSPLAILISSYHGNTDSIVVCLALAAVLAADRDRPLLAGSLIALACGLKLGAILTVPAVVLTTRPEQRRSSLVAMGAVSAAVWIPGVILSPATFLQRTIGYAPNGGHFGFNVLLNGLVDALPHDQAPWWIARALRFAFMRSSRVLIAVIFVLTFVAYARQHLRGPALAAFGNVLFLAFTSGFGTQYLIWPAANGLFLGFGWAAAYHAAAGLFLCLLYNNLSQGSWWYVSFFENPPWSVQASAAGIVTWMILLAWASLLIDKLLRSRWRNRGAASSGRQSGGDGRRAESTMKRTTGTVM